MKVVDSVYEVRCECTSNYKMGSIARTGRFHLPALFLSVRTLLTRLEKDRMSLGNTEYQNKKKVYYLFLFLARYLIKTHGWLAPKRGEERFIDINRKKRKRKTKRLPRSSRMRPEFPHAVASTPKTPRFPSFASWSFDLPLFSLERKKKSRR